MNKNLKFYYDYTISPLGQLFYESVWEQLPEIKNKKVLDFGSGFGFTSNKLSDNNTVIAVEPSEEVIKYALNKEKYTQLNGSVDILKTFDSKSFDVIICHLVFEFVDEYDSILKEFSRLLKDDGFISIVRHNKEGRIIQCLSLIYDIGEATSLLDGDNSYSPTFGDIKYYTNDDVLSKLDNFILDKSYGVRTFASLQNSEVQSKETWLKDMLNVERKVYSNASFKNIAYFNHLILKKDI